MLLQGMSFRKAQLYNCLDHLQANQFRVAEAHGVEAVVAAMQRFPHQTTVQLSALLCFIPLALENLMMQVSKLSHVLPHGVNS